MLSQLTLWSVYIFSCSVAICCLPVAQLPYCSLSFTLAQFPYFVKGISWEPWQQMTTKQRCFCVVIVKAFFFSNFQVWLKPERFEQNIENNLKNIDKRLSNKLVRFSTKEKVFSKFSLNLCILGTFLKLANPAEILFESALE